MTMREIAKAIPVFKADHPLSILYDRSITLAPRGVERKGSKFVASARAPDSPRPQKLGGSPMTERGTFVLDRGWFDHPAFKDEPYTEREAWAWMISNAAYLPHSR